MSDLEEREGGQQWLEQLEAHWYMFMIKVETLTFVTSTI
jgi:hypothetical protein